MTYRPLTLPPVTTRSAAVCPPKPPGPCTRYRRRCLTRLMGTRKSSVRVVGGGYGARCGVAGSMIKIKYDDDDYGGVRACLCVRARSGGSVTYGFGRSIVYVTRRPAGLPLPVFQKVCSPPVPRGWQRCSPSPQARRQRTRLEKRARALFLPPFPPGQSSSFPGGAPLRSSSSSPPPRRHSTLTTTATVHRACCVCVRVAWLRLVSVCECV